jgi:hypothetical protein
MRLKPRARCSPLLQPGSPEIAAATWHGAPIAVRAGTSRRGTCALRSTTGARLPARGPRALFCATSRRSGLRAGRDACAGVRLAPRLLCGGWSAPARRPHGTPAQPPPPTTGPPRPAPPRPRRQPHAQRQAPGERRGVAPGGGHAMLIKHLVCEGSRLWAASADQACCHSACLGPQQPAQPPLTARSFGTRASPLLSPEAATAHEQGCGMASPRMHKPAVNGGTPAHHLPPPACS